MSNTLNCKVLVVGGGPGGYVAAIRAGQLGLDTIIVESAELGGTCLNHGCIPSKALIHASTKYQDLMKLAENEMMGISLSADPKLNLAGLVDWKDSVVQQLSGGVATLLDHAKVRAVKGWATFSNAKTCVVETDDGVVVIHPEHVILANGSVATELPFLPFGNKVISSTEALSPGALPDKLVVVGGGYIGIELGIVYRKLGCDVTIVEADKRILPLFDKQLTRPVERWLKSNGVKVLTSVKAKGMLAEGGKDQLFYVDSKEDQHWLEADKVLVTVGRKPCTEGWGLENMAVDMDGPFVQIDDQCATSMKNVWAIGDIVGEPMLAHKASAQGEMVAEIIAGKKRTFDPVAIPAVCFVEPEIISVGLSESDAKVRGKEQGYDIVVGKFPFAANGRALSMQAGDDGGFIRVVSRADTHQVLGVQGVGAHISELIGEFTLALEMGARLEDIFGTIHAHPTLGEAFPEAAMKSLGHAIHG